MQYELPNQTEQGQLRIKRINTEKYQEQVHIGQDDLNNVYSFVYLGVEIASDGDPEVTIQHRINIIWGQFGEYLYSYRQVLTAAKLPIYTRIRLYRALIVSTGCCAWLFTNSMRKKTNGVNSKMLSQITQRSIIKKLQNQHLTLWTTSSNNVGNT